MSIAGIVTAVGLALSVGGGFHGMSAHGAQGAVGAIGRGHGALGPVGPLGRNGGGRGPFAGPYGGWDPAGRSPGWDGRRWGGRGYEPGRHRHGETSDAGYAYGYGGFPFDDGFDADEGQASGPGPAGGYGFAGPSPYGGFPPPYAIVRRPLARAPAPLVYGSGPHDGAYAYGYNGHAETPSLTSLDQ